MGHRCDPGPTLSAAIEGKWELWLPAVTSRAVSYLIQCLQYEGCEFVQAQACYYRPAQNVYVQKKIIPWEVRTFRYKREGFKSSLGYFTT